jgi:hypothetical protein
MSGSDIGGYVDNGYEAVYWVYMFASVSEAPSASIFKALSARRDVRTRKISHCLAFPSEISLELTSARRHCMLHVLRPAPATTVYNGAFF